MGFGRTAALEAESRLPASAALDLQGRRRPALLAETPPRPQLFCAYDDSLRSFFACADLARAGALGLRLGPVSLRWAAGQAIDALVARAGAASHRLELDGRRDAIGCADPAHLEKIVRHLLLGALVDPRRAGRTCIGVETGGGEARLLIASAAPPSPLELDAARELMGAMGGAVRAADDAEDHTLRLILRGLPTAQQLRNAA